MNSRYYSLLFMNSKQDYTKLRDEREREEKERRGGVRSE
jgi:hypothetical protein